MWCGCGKKKKKGHKNDAFSDDDDYYYAKPSTDVGVTRVLTRVRGALLPKKQSLSPKRWARTRSGAEDRQPYEAIARPHETQSSASQSVGSLADILLPHVSLPHCLAACVVVISMR